MLGKETPAQASTRKKWLGQRRKTAVMILLAHSGSEKRELPSGNSLKSNILLS